MTNADYEARIVALENEVNALKLQLINNYSKDSALSPFFEFIYKCAVSYQQQLTKSGRTTQIHRK